MIVGKVTQCVLRELFRGQIMNFKKLVAAILISSMAVSPAVNVAIAAPSGYITDGTVDKKDTASTNTRYVKQKAAEEAKAKREAEAAAKKQAAEEAKAAKEAEKTEAERKKTIEQAIKNAAAWKEYQAKKAETAAKTAEAESAAAVEVKTPEQLAKEAEERKAAAYAEEAAVSVFDTYYDHLYGAWEDKDGEPTTTHPGSSLSFKVFGTDKVELELGIVGSITMAACVDDGEPYRISNGTVELPDMGWHDVCIYVDSARHEYNSSVTIKSVNIGEGNAVSIDKEQYLFLGDSLFEGMNDISAGESSFVESIPYEAATQYDVIPYERRLPVAVAAPGSGLIKTEYYAAATEFFTETPIHCHPSKIFLSFGSNDLKLEAQANTDEDGENENGENTTAAEGEQTGDQAAGDQANVIVNADGTTTTVDQTATYVQQTIEIPDGMTVTEAVTEEYAKFVSMVQERYPDVPIFVLVPFYNQAYTSAIHSLTGVTVIETSAMTVAYTDGVHPDQATCDYVGSVIKDMADTYDGINTGDYRKNDYVLYNGEYILESEAEELSSYSVTPAQTRTEAPEHVAIRTEQDQLIQDSGGNVSVTTNATEGTTRVAPEKTETQTESDIEFVSDDTDIEFVDSSDSSAESDSETTAISFVGSSEEDSTTAESPFSLVTSGTETTGDFIAERKKSTAVRLEKYADHKAALKQKEETLSKTQSINEEERAALIPTYVYKEAPVDSEETGIGAVTLFD